MGAIYKHYKGNLYEVIGEALHTETEEILVLYVRHGAADKRVFARPKEIFAEMVVHDGFTVHRFLRVK